MAELFDGELLETRTALGAASRLRAKTYHEISIPLENWEKYQGKGWSLKKKYKTKVRIRKEKTEAEKFEDAIWLMFYKMGFTPMSKGRDFKIVGEGISKQIDVIACDEDYIFVVECKSSETGNKQIQPSVIRELSDCVFR